MLIHQQANINMIFSHTAWYLFIFNNNIQNGPNLGPIENRASHGPFPVYHRIIMISKHITKPEDINPGIKTKPQQDPGLIENIPENLVRIFRNQSQNFNLNCPKTVPKFSLDYLKKSQKFLKIPTLSPKNLRLKFTAFHGV